MAKGKSIYFTKKEIDALIMALKSWEELEKEKSEDVYAHMILECGVGAAWRKIAEAAVKEKV